MAKRKLKNIITSECQYLTDNTLASVLVLFVDSERSKLPVITKKTTLLSLRKEMEEKKIEDPTAYFEEHRVGRNLVVLINEIEEGEE